MQTIQISYDPFTQRGSCVWNKEVKNGVTAFEELKQTIRRANTDKALENFVKLNNRLGFTSKEEIIEYSARGRSGREPKHKKLGSFKSFFIEYFS